MKKYIFLIVLEVLIEFYWLVFNLHFLNNSLIYIYIIGFPLIYIIFLIIDLINKNKWYVYLLSMMPILFSVIFTFFHDGTTTFLSNPDSSLHGWFFFYNFIRIIIQIGGIIIIVLSYHIIYFIVYIIKKLQHSKENNM